MIISADTESELDEAIVSHIANGWTVTERGQRSDGAFTALLVIGRKGDWISTFTGKRFYPLDPKPDDVCIEDIAHSLAMQCRFNGHTIDFYSIAEHSIHLSHYVSAENALWALLHDASEAYLCDIPSPIKPMITGYYSIERDVMKVIAKKFGLSSDIPEEVKQADKRIIADEVDIFLTDPSWVKTERFNILNENHGWNWSLAEDKFLNRFIELTR